MNRHENTTRCMLVPPKTRQWKCDTCRSSLCTHSVWLAGSNGSSRTNLFVLRSRDEVQIHASALLSLCRYHVKAIRQNSWVPLVTTANRKQANNTHRKGEENSTDLICWAPFPLPGPNSVTCSTHYPGPAASNNNNTKCTADR